MASYLYFAYKTFFGNRIALPKATTGIVCLQMVTIYFQINKKSEWSVTLALFRLGCAPSLCRSVVLPPREFAGKSFLLFPFCGWQLFVLPTRCTVAFPEVLVVTFCGFGSRPTRKNWYRYRVNFCKLIRNRLIFTLPVLFILQIRDAREYWVCQISGVAE